MSIRDITQRRFAITLWDVTRWTLVVVISGLIVSPIAYALSVSFRPRSAVFGPIHLIPKQFTVTPWVTFLQDALPYLFNSLMIATGASILILLVAVPGAYAFARKEFPGRKKLFYSIVLIMLIPKVMIVVPITQISRWIQLHNTVFGIWLALMIGGMPPAVWILRDNFGNLPPNTEEAAQVYGCTQFESFIRVILPLATPAIIAVAFLSFLSAWTEFLFTNLLSTQSGAQPAVVYLFSLLNPDYPIDWPYTMAGAFIISIPPLVFYALARRYLEKALNF